MSSIRDFIPLSKVGQGTFSTVYKVRRVSDQKIYAIKKVRLNNLSQKQKQNALNQIRILASFECQYIVAYKEAFFDQKLNVLCIVMEFADGGDLHKVIDSAKKDYRSIPEKDIWKFINHILTGLKHLHDKGILHRDLKSANIFVSGDKYKLGDLNVSKVNGGKLAYTQTGTPYYASPQVWRDQPYDSKSDIWSFGCIIYEMACLRPPFNGKDMQQLYRSVQNKKYTAIPQKYSFQLSNFIHKCLQKNPQQRSTAAQLLQSLNTNKVQNSSEKVQNQQLLKTIKLPTDLKSLQNKLPQSKYENRKSVDYHSPKNYVSDREYNSIKNNFSMRPSSIKSPKHINVMNSQIFLSPRNVNKNSIQFLSPGQVGSKKTTSAHINLSQKKIQPSKYSQRIEALQNRKIYSSHNHKSELIDKYDRFIKDQMSKHSIGMPRTQKRKIESQNGPDRRAIEEWKKKLVKKSRIMSNNSKHFLIN